MEVAAFQIQQKNIYHNSLSNIINLPLRFIQQSQSKEKDENVLVLSHNAKIIQKILRDVSDIVSADVFGRLNPGGVVGKDCDCRCLCECKCDCDCRCLCDDDALTDIVQQITQLAKFRQLSTRVLTNQFTRK
ncbi:MAG TPA: hypothetical protein DCK76_11735 [Desulfotomaculum sp.]|nr:MAG: hypothetical protein XD78_1843 [Desulfotomaculum sp. 46_296]HAG12009.1 hypothetical protein [Desulfotomaculum sp.]HBY05235.1 hypothetical protein [Desulfotomaculum sp.]